MWCPKGLNTFMPNNDSWKEPVTYGEATVRLVCYLYPLENEAVDFINSYSDGKTVDHITSLRWLGMTRRIPHNKQELYRVDGTIV